MTEKELVRAATTRESSEGLTHATTTEGRTTFQRCEGRYPVPQERSEPFPVTYRCGLAHGHMGPCQSAHEQESMASRSAKGLGGSVQEAEISMRDEKKNDLGEHICSAEGDDTQLRSVPADVAPHADPEICICAAIRFYKDGTIIRGHRHDSCYKTAMAIPALSDYLHQAEQGFVTSRNRFVGRKEARQLQTAAGIPSVATGDYRGDILFSEDLY